MSCHRAIPFVTASRLQVAGHNLAVTSVERGTLHLNSTTRPPAVQASFPDVTILRYIIQRAVGFYITQGTEIRAGAPPWVNREQIWIGFNFTN